MKDGPHVGKSVGRKPLYDPDSRNLHERHRPRQGPGSAKESALLEAGGRGGEEASRGCPTEAAEGQGSTPPPLGKGGQAQGAREEKCAQEVAFLPLLRASL